VSRRKGWIFFALGLVLALSAAAMVFVVLQNAEAKPSEGPPPIPTAKLPVAARPLEPGMKLSSADYIMKDFPLDLVPVSAISETVNLDSQLLIRPVGQGETFRSDQFLGGQGASMSQQIKQGMVLFAFPIVDLMSQSDVVRDGDHVDLLLTLPLKGLSDATGDAAAAEKDLGQATALTLQNIEVYKVLRTTKKEDQPEGAPTALMISVTPADAVILKYAKDSDGKIDFTLRSPLDTEPFVAPYIDRAEFSKKYIIAHQ
jgi:pilus assembly protein CpaB